MHITDLTKKESASGGTRIEASVDGEPLWFESDDVTLRPAVEAYASALLIPAASKGTPLAIDPPVDPVWLEQAPAVLHLIRSWWSISEVEVIAQPSASACVSQPEHTAQCFTGGVDSFYALISSIPPPRMLVFAHGFDISLDDRRRVEFFISGFRETAARYGAKPVIIRTNLRRHRAMRRVSWERTHGGAVAALGHLLSEHVGRLVIPSGYPYHEPVPWGSRWDLDPLWSSRCLSVEHADASVQRHQKLCELARHEMPMRHLRVCWENRAPTGNCSRCEKCIRTMLALATYAPLENCQAFDLSVPIESRVDQLSAIPVRLVSIYEIFARQLPDPRTREAVERLIKRSMGYRGRISTVARRIRIALRPR